MERQSRRSFALPFGMILATAAVAAASDARAASIAGRVALSGPVAAQCETLDVIASVRKLGAGGEVLVERRSVARATAKRDDRRRWAYRLAVEPIAPGAGGEEVELSARCNSGRDPLDVYRVVVPGASAWSNPFPLPADGGALRRSFRVKHSRAAEPPAEVVMGPVATDAFGGIARSGASPCDAALPEMSMGDPNGSLCGYSNDAGNGCSAQTTIDGNLLFDVSLLQEWSDRIDRVELRYGEEEIAWRDPSGGMWSPRTCVAIAYPESGPPGLSGTGRAVGDGRTTWDVTDVVEWWIDSEETATSFMLLGNEPAGGSSACLSRVTDAELVVRFFE